MPPDAKQQVTLKVKHVVISIKELLPRQLSSYCKKGRVELYQDDSDILLDMFALSKSYFFIFESSLVSSSKLSTIPLFTSKSTEMGNTLMSIKYSMNI